MRRKFTIEAMRFAAKKRRGECLSKAYIDSSTHLHWRCRHGHEWQATPNKIQQGKWCPRCAGKGKTISEMQQAASLRDGMCLSKKYKGMFVKLLWKCGKGHKFKTMPNQVLNHGTWCPECYLESKGLTPAECRRQLREMKRLARSKGGRCLSTEYKNNQTHLQWRCKNGHEWMAAPSHTKHSGTWCATCAAGVSERICRAVMERIFGAAFPKKKPAWLLSKRQTRMELDGYAEELGVAFEYQGIQHFIKTNVSIRVALHLDEGCQTINGKRCCAEGTRFFCFKFRTPYHMVGSRITSARWRRHAPLPNKQTVF